ncbi:hypothetical protein CcCBS67573_g00446 [Chytriomyces confervae]|uniref:Uncharacterized protein n=1 Tax=Chytriomyces confervae TaxID=246404 RepID=A0A507FSE7_9FUNG|nr:hypothetical protein CcCBS67573_g00446 [Chytriomyces confervae]
MTRSRRDVGVERMGGYMLSGWVLTDSQCRTPNCNLPTFRTKDATRINVCCLCHDDRDPIPPVSGAGTDDVLVAQEAEPAQASELEEDDDDFDMRPPPVSDRDSSSASHLLGQRLLAGWTMLASNCQKCHITPLMEKGGVTVCVKCEASSSQAPQQPSQASQSSQPSKYAKTENGSKRSTASGPVPNENSSSVDNEDDEEFWNELLESAPPSKYMIAEPPKLVSSNVSHSVKSKNVAQSNPGNAVSALDAHMRSLTLALNQTSGNYVESKTICDAIKSCAEAIEARAEMYTLLSGLYELYTRKEDYFVIILGLDNAGKTTLLERIKSTYSSKEIPIHPDKIAPTVGLNSTSRAMPNQGYESNPTLLPRPIILFAVGTIDLDSTCINFWDLGGQQELRRLWKKYYSESHAVLFVCDASDFERIEEARDTFESVVGTEELEGVPMLLLANKSDKAGAISVANLKELFNPVASKLGARDSKVLSVSALKGEGVREAMDWLILRLERNRVNRPPVLRPRSHISMVVSPYVLFTSPMPYSAASGPPSTCIHLTAMKHAPQTVALTKGAIQLLDRYRDCVRQLLGNTARGHFPLMSDKDKDKEKKRKKTSQLEHDIDWVTSIPFPICKSCLDTGFSRLHQCLHCPFMGCFKQNHIHAHLNDPTVNHCFAIDYHHGALFCAKCNDYVWDLDFERVLACEKVRMDALVSKVKDSTIRRSKNVEWLPSLDDAMKIQKFSTPLQQCSGIRGLSNMGSTCFMNVVLQSFIHNPLLRAHFLSDKHNQNLCRLKKAGKPCMACEMDTLFTNFYSGETIPYSPQSFLYATWMSNSALARYAQQDAHEFFISVLNEIHSNCSILNSKDPNSACRCIIHLVFQGYLQSDVTCSHCKNVTTAKDPILDLSLNIKSLPASGSKRKGTGGGGSTPNLQAPAAVDEAASSCSLIECLDRNFAAEKLTHYQCGNAGCGKSSESVKHVTIKNLPPVLAIQLKRFEHSGQGSTKVDTFVKIPTNLDMTPFTTQSVQSRAALSQKGAMVEAFDHLK